MLASPTPGAGELCVVVDNGSGRIKVGFAGAEVPKAVLPTSGLEGVSDDRRPLAHGIIQDWDAMETYWDHAFTNLLDIDTEQVNILIAANMFETKDNRERIVHTLFETFAAPNVYLASAPVWQLLRTDRAHSAQEPQPYLSRCSSCTLPGARTVWCSE